MHRRVVIWGSRISSLLDRLVSGVATPTAMFGVNYSDGFRTGPANSSNAFYGYSKVFDFVHNDSSRPEGSGVMTLAVERRAADRHDTVNNRTNVQLMDWIGPRIREAKLVNISSSGALIQTDQLPALHQPLRVRLEIAKEVGWFSAIPVRFGQSNEVGIQFVRPLPLYFLSKSTPVSDTPMPARTGEGTH
jgi:hypothetical protein